MGVALFEVGVRANAVLPTKGWRRTVTGSEPAFHAVMTRC